MDEAAHADGEAFIADGTTVEAQTWHASARHCSCCKGFIFGCTAPLCRQIGICACSYDEEDVGDEGFVLNENVVNARPQEDRAHAPAAPRVVLSRRDVRGGGQARGSGAAIRGRGGAHARGGGGDRRAPPVPALPPADEAMMMAALSQMMSTGGFGDVASLATALTMQAEVDAMARQQQQQQQQLMMAEALYQQMQPQHRVGEGAVTGAALAAAAGMAGAFGVNLNPPFPVATLQPTATPQQWVPAAAGDAGAPMLFNQLPAAFYPQQPYGLQQPAAAYGGGDEWVRGSAGAATAPPPVSAGREAQLLPAALLQSPATATQQPSPTLQQQPPQPSGSGTPLTVSARPWSGAVATAPATSPSSALSPAAAGFVPSRATAAAAAAAFTVTRPRGGDTAAAAGAARSQPSARPRAPYTAVAASGVGGGGGGVAHSRSDVPSAARNATAPATAAQGEVSSTRTAQAPVQLLRRGETAAGVGAVAAAPASAAGSQGAIAPVKPAVAAAAAAAATSGDRVAAAAAPATVAPPAPAPLPPAPVEVPLSPRSRAIADLERGLRASRKKLRDIADLEAKSTSGTALNADQQRKVGGKQALLDAIADQESKLAAVRG